MSSHLAESPVLIETEDVVLLDEQRRPVGTMAKSEVHTTQTPLHLAFSVYVTDDQGRLLVTRRALSKRTWPGVWTNSCCGHPQPEESFDDAVARRVESELGMGVSGVSMVLPDFAYRAVAADGIVENEFCPVFVARAVGQVRPDPAEVAEFTWADWSDYRQAAACAPWTLSPWTVLQVAELGQGADDLRDLLT